jgi:hypothetical protein
MRSTRPVGKLEPAEYGDRRWKRIHKALTRGRGTIGDVCICEGLWWSKLDNMNFLGRIRKGDCLHGSHASVPGSD